VLSRSRIEEGDYVLILINRKRKWVIRVDRSKKFSSDKGILDLNTLIGAEYGSEVPLSTGIKAEIHRPLLIDFIERGFSRATQVIYPKDAGYMIYMSGVSSGSRVLEAGVGSGFLTATIANIVKPHGKVYAYEIRKEFIELALRNLKMLNLNEFVEIKQRDVKEGIDEKDLDAAFIDIPDPWEALNNLYQALKPSAPILFFFPTINQVEKLYEAIKEHKGFSDLRCVEILLREYRVTKGMTRPSTRMIGHTGYIVFARKRKISP